MAKNGLNPFDYAMELKKMGIPGEQADLHAKAYAHLADNAAATKQDLEVTKLELKRDIVEVKAELKRDIEEVKADLKRDVEEVRAELKRDIAESRAELKRDIRELGFKMTIASGSFAFLILGSLVALVKLGLLTPSS